MALVPASVFQFNHPFSSFLWCSSTTADPASTLGLTHARTHARTRLPALGAQHPWAVSSGPGQGFSAAHTAAFSVLFPEARDASVL